MSPAAVRNRITLASEELERRAHGGDEKALWALGFLEDVAQQVAEATYEDRHIQATEIYGGPHWVVPKSFEEQE